MAGFFKVVVDFLGIMLSRIQSIAVLHFMAFKTVMITLAITILPIIINNFLYEIIGILTDLVSEVSISSSVTSQSFGGFAGWLLIKCKVIDGFSIIISCATVRYTISLLTLGRL